MFCSQFVDNLLRDANIDVTYKAKGLVKPMDFTTSKILVQTFDGNIDDYDPDKIKNNLKNRISSEIVSEESKVSKSKAVIDGGYEHDGRWNSLIVRSEFPDKVLRHRVEILIFKDNKIYGVLKNGKFILPGGSIERGISDAEQVSNEALEEARILCKNIRHTGLHYSELYTTPNEWMNKLPIKWDGQFTEVYTGDYNGKYTGDIDPRDIDDMMLKEGRFHQYSEIKDILRFEHKRAVLNYLFVNEAKTLVEVDKEGNVIINNPKLNYQKEYDKAHKLLLT